MAVFSDVRSEDFLSSFSAEQCLDQFCEMAMQALNGTSLVILLRTKLIARVIAGCGSAAQFGSRMLAPGATIFKEDDTVSTQLPSSVPAVVAMQSFLGQPDAAWLYRTPVTVTEQYSLSMVVTGDCGQPRPSTRASPLLNRLKELIAESIQVSERHLIDANQAGVAIMLTDLTARVNDRQDRALLLDQELTIRAISDTMAAAFERPRQALIGRNYAEFELPASDAIGAILRRALATKVSAPNCEIVDTARQTVFSLRVSPVQPIGTSETYLLISSVDITDHALRRSALYKQVGITRPDEPSLAFLHETLVERRTIRSRNNVSYITLRSWRASIRTWQIKALKALKAAIPPEMPGTIADEIIAETAALVGAAAFRAIVPVPCSHSGMDSCLALEIARAVAGRLNVPVVQAFAVPEQSGASHPKKNLRRPPMILVNPVDGPTLLVDDVATSGAHLEEATTLLRACTTSVLAIAWIGGDSN